MTDQELKAIRDRAAKATPPPWLVKQSADHDPKTTNTVAIVRGLAVESEKRWAQTEARMPAIVRRFKQDVRRHGSEVAIARAVLRLIGAGFTRDEAVDLMARAVREAHR